MELEVDVVVLAVVVDEVVVELVVVELVMVDDVVVLVVVVLAVVVDELEVKVELVVVVELVLVVLEVVVVELEVEVPGVINDRQRRVKTDRPQTHCAARSRAGANERCAFVPELVVVVRELVVVELVVVVPAPQGDAIQSRHSAAKQSGGIERVWS